MQNFNNTSVRIDQWIMVQSGTYQHQWRRPMNTVVTDQSIELMRAATRDGRNLGVAAVQDLASSMVSPDAMVEGQVHIADGNGGTNGWSERRFRGMIRVREEHPVYKGTATQRIFYIYTDKCDASLQSGLLDPNMRVYFNSETVINETMVPTPMGLRKQATVQSSNQIVTPIDMVSGNNQLFGQATAFLVRPEDVFASEQNNHTITRLQSTGRFNGKINKQWDHRSMVGECGAYQYSHRQDTSPTRYVSNILNAFQHSVRESEMSDQDFGPEYGQQPGSASMEVVLGEASSYAANANIQLNSFLAILKQRAGYMERGYVLWGDLIQIFPELNDPNVMRVAFDNGQSIRKVSQVGDSNHWHGADQLSIAAATLSQVIPSLMMDTFFRSVSFSITNGRMPGEYSILPHVDNILSIMDGIDAPTMQGYILEFERRLATDVLNAITFRGQVPFQISFQSDLAGDTILDIRIDGSQQTRFIAPTFTDSLFSPVITNDGQRAAKVANDMVHLAAEVIPNDLGKNAIFADQWTNKTEDYLIQGYQRPMAAPAFVQPNQGGINAASFEGL